MYTLFYAEDDQDDVFLFQSVLNEMNIKHELVVANNGQELIDSLNNPPPSPQIVFIDLNMPVKNGLESLEEIRASIEYGKVPIIILSTSSDEDAIEKARQLGADLYIVKPSNYGKLKAFLQECLAIDWLNFRKDPMQVFLIK
jgi:CheY-like chemotaxis protein